MRLQCLPSVQFGRFIGRELETSTSALDLAEVFSTLLQRANAFVPSEAAAILLEDPAFQGSRTTRPLILVASLGEVPPGKVGDSVAARGGLIRRTYLTGRAHVTPSDDDTPLSCDGLATMLLAPVSCAICAPLGLGGRTVGVIELVNRLSRDAYSLRELSLLEIFAHTISASIAVATEAERLRELSKRDDLTGLYNDRHLHRELGRIVARACDRGSDLGVLFIDLDHFKSVNDRWGHLVGSRVLKEVSALLIRCLPAHAIAARYGGDEFVVALAGHGRPTTLDIAELIRRSVEQAVFLEQEDPSDPGNYPAMGLRGIVTCSIGAAILDHRAEPGREPEAAKNRLLHTADECMYLAKTRGRNRVVAAWDAE